MKITSILTDEAALGELARRIRRARLDRQMTQADLAVAAGVARPTIERFEASGSGQLTTLIRVLRALDLLDRLDAVAPESTIRPIEALEGHGRERKRASRRRKVEAPVPPNKAWTWGDQR
jgi:transcriptional regulator with XRE-family HTH domain